MAKEPKFQNEMICVDMATILIVNVHNQQIISVC